MATRAGMLTVKTIFVKWSVKQRRKHQRNLVFQVRIDRSNEEENERPATAEIQKSPTKRASTNVKGLTVNIPSNTAFKEQNSSMPLSPAQERWISMSIGAVPPPTSSAAEKDAISSLSKNGVEQEQEKKHEICSRDDDIDDYGFLVSFVTSRITFG